MTLPPTLLPVSIARLSCIKTISNIPLSRPLLISAFPNSNNMRLDVASTIWVPPVIRAQCRRYRICLSQDFFLKSSWIFCTPRTTSCGVKWNATVSASAAHISAIRDVSLGCEIVIPSAGCVFSGASNVIGVLFFNLNSPTRKDSSITAYLLWSKTTCPANALSFVLFFISSICFVT